MLPRLCRGKPALPSKSLSILEEEVRKRHHSNGQERQQARGPLIAERLVHLDAKERERRWRSSAQPQNISDAIGREALTTEAAAGEAIGGQRAGCI